MKIKNQKSNFPVVCLGASAGGLSVFQTFFSFLPTILDIDISFILIQHLSPDSNSKLSEIIQKYTNMDVFEVKNNTEIKPKSIYVIPPNYDMKLTGYSLKLVKQPKDKIIKLPIDFFLKSMAKELKENSISIILSGNGNDGAQGIREIKENNGLVLVQKRATAQYKSMPQNAIETGFVDLELTIEDIAQNLIEYIKNKDLNNSWFLEHYDIQEKQKILTLLRDVTGHDFSNYKENTIDRRINKSMQQNKIDNLKDYYQFLTENDEQVFELIDEILINVTRLFRDKEVFESLAKNAIPKLFSNKPINAPIRVWVAGCSTGEEAYSIAILIKEYMLKNSLKNKVMIFATDIDSKAISVARKRVFPSSIEEDVTSSRLKKFFYQNNSGGYGIVKDIRDMIIFSEHNIIKDPPFINLDLLSCRNVMIYMDSKLQRNLILQFHYAIYPSGLLLLGSSESVGDLGNYFKNLDLKNNIFQCNNSLSTFNQITRNSILKPMENYTKSLSNQQDIMIVKQMKPSLKEIIEQAILKYYTPTAVLIDEDGNILYLVGNTSEYLELPQGEYGINNIFKMFRKELKEVIEESFHKIKNTKQTIKVENIMIKTKDSYKSIDTTLSAVISSSNLESTSYLYLIIFEDKNTEDEKVKEINLTANIKDDGDEKKIIKKLKEEIRVQKQYLEETNERLKLSNQELTSYNEEMQSLNEEMQSTNEELETSREELQSLNEELTIVNSELQVKVNDLTTVNNDMNNLISGTGIGTIFVNHELNILRFTPTIKPIINLIPGDTGRYLGDIVSNVIDNKLLLEKTQDVLDTLIPKEAQIVTDNGLIYFMRIHPYRTVENVIEGAVITFIEVTDIIKKTAQL